MAKGRLNIKKKINWIKKLKLLKFNIIWIELQLSQNNKKKVNDDDDSPPGYQNKKLIELKNLNYLNSM